MFFRGSRYEAVPDATFVAADGRAIRYKSIRLVPPAVNPASTAYTVEPGDRHDMIAWRVLRDPEAFWRLCDLAGVDRPADLAQAGRRIPIPAPNGSGARTA